MKKTLLTSVILLFGTLSILGQEKNTHLVSEHWGDYYYVNQNFKKAVNFYTRSKDSLPIDTRRNWALALRAVNKMSEAKMQYTAVANSIEARVEDYYIYANLLVLWQLSQYPLLQKLSFEKKLPLDALEFTVMVLRIGPTRLVSYFT